MIPVHRSVELDPYERGRSFGHANSDSVANTLTAYEHLFRTAGIDGAEVNHQAKQVGAVLDDNWPELRREIAGIADGAGQDELDVLAVNARTEVLAGQGVPECTVICTQDEHAHTILAQNWDYHPRLAGSAVVWIVERPGGRWFATLTEAGLLAKIGLTDTGLGVGLNLLMTNMDGGATEVPIHVLLRLVLEHCRTVDEAAALLQRASTSVSSAVTLAQAREPSLAAQYPITVELSPGGAKMVRGGSTGRVYVHTNHFLAPPRAGHDTIVCSHPDTVQRLEALTTTAPIGLSAVRASLASHEGHPHSICRHEGAGVGELDQTATLASIVMRLEDLRLEIALGPPCRAAYELVELPGPDRAPLIDRDHVRATGG